jgi:hypothetical protein
MNFDISVDIAAPPDTVWAVISDVERWHEWTPSVRMIRLLDKRPLTVGTRLFIRQPRFPPAVWKVRRIEPGRSFVSETGGPGLRVLAHHSIEPVGDGSRATLRLEYSGMLGTLLARLTRGITGRYLEYEATGLRRRSESLARSS